MCCHNISCDNMNSGFFSAYFFSATLHLHAGNQQRRALRGGGTSSQIRVSRMKILKLQHTGGIATSRVASDARVPPPVCTAPSRSLFLVRARGSRLPPWFQNQNRCAIFTDVRGHGLFWLYVQCRSTTSCGNMISSLSICTLSEMFNLINAVLRST